MKNNYKFDYENNCVIIYLKNRKGEKFETIIDIDDFELVNSYSGTFFPTYFPRVHDYYCIISLYMGMNEKGESICKTTYLHRIITNVTDTKIKIDHYNHNTLDNRKANLIVGNNTTNSQNRKGINKNNKSGYRNVSLINGYFQVQLQIDGKNYRFPNKFTDAKEAGKFAEEMRIKYYGDYAGNS